MFFELLKPLLKPLVLVAAFLRLPNNDATIAREDDLKNGTDLCNDANVALLRVDFFF